MEDSQIVSLFWERNELAIKESSSKYGRYCYTIAYNILRNKEDSEECVSDTYWGAWECIPPHRPSVLGTFLGKLTRRISLNRWRDQTRQKRGSGEVSLALDELSECIASDVSIEKTIEQKELSQAIRMFLGSLKPLGRDVFVCRYWFVSGIDEIAVKFGFSQSKVKSMLFRTREKLRAYLIEEGLQ